MKSEVNVTVPPARLVFSPEDRARILGLVDESLQSGSLTLGPMTQRFEEMFAGAHEAPFAVATSSGTSSLEIILRSLGVAGAEVVVPDNTFYATAGAVLHAGGRPRFADVSAQTFAITAASVEAALTPATAGVVIVHIGGLISPEIEEIRQLCDRRGIFLVEDAAHAHGCRYNGRPAGSFGVAAAFSFYPTKVVTSAEGGMILTSDERLAADARIYRDQGKAGFLGGEHVRLGSAWRLSELQAAVGIVQVGRLGEFIKRRCEVAERYDAAFADEFCPLLLPPGCESNYYKYPLLLPRGCDRAAVKGRIREQYGVMLSGEVYARPLHAEPALRDFADGPLPIAEDICSRHVCLPIHSDMTDAEVEIVIRAVTEALTA
jgi:perosamine synthetase